MDPLRVVSLVAAACAAGAINSIAGGGTLLTFPALLAAGLPATAANATSTVALVPGSAGAMWGYRREVFKDRRHMLALALPSLAGGLIGALLVLRAGDPLFARLVPWLILAATLLFAVGGRLRARAGSEARLPMVIGLQLVISVYGGFFGAGMGIAILAGLSLLGMTDLHRMNGLKNLTAICINGVAAITFAASGKVVWPLALAMAAGASAGGYGGARLARRVGQNVVRVAIIVIGAAISVYFFARQLSAAGP